MAYPQRLRLLFHAFGVDATISRQQPGRAPKDAPLLHDGRDCLVAVRFSRGEDVLTRDDPALDFREHHLTAKLHRGSAFVSWNEARVRLKQTAHLLAGRDLPAL